MSVTRSELHQYSINFESERELYTFALLVKKLKNREKIIGFVKKDFTLKEEKLIDELYDLFDFDDETNKQT